MEALLDTGCTKLVHPRCVGEDDYLGWNIPYHTTSNRKTYFPAASVQLEVEGRTTKIPVGVSEHIGQDMLMGRDIPHFRHFVRKELEKELKKEEPTPPDSITTESGMIVTRAQLLQQTTLEEERLQQEQDRAMVSDPYPVDGGTQVERMELVAEEFSTEVPGESQMGEHETEGAGALEDPMGVLTPQELGIAQRSDTTLKIIREKVRREGSPYFWEKGILHLLDHGKNPNCTSPSYAYKGPTNGQ